MILILNNFKNLKVMASNPNIMSKFEKNYITFNCFKKTFVISLGMKKKYSSKLSSN